MENNNKSNSSNSNKFELFNANKVGRLENRQYDKTREVKSVDYDEKIGNYSRVENLIVNKLKQLRESVYRLGGAACFVIGGKFLSGIIVGFLESSKMYSADSLYFISFVLNIFISYGLFAVLVYRFFKDDYIPEQEIKKTSVSIITLISVFFAIYFCMFSGNVITSFIFPEVFTKNSGFDELNSFQTIIFSLLSIIIAPILEELLFRKLIFSKLIRFGSILSIMVTSLLYAISHGDITQFLYSFLSGILLGYLVIWTGSIIPSIFIHILINAADLVLTQLLKLAEAGLLGISAVKIQISLYAMLILGAFSLIIIIGSGKHRDENCCPEIATSKKISGVAMNPAIVLAFALSILSYFLSLRTG